MKITNTSVAYMDGIGFSNLVQNDENEANLFLKSIYDIIETSIKDTICCPLEQYPNSLRDIASRNYVDEINYLQPFSDSIFFQSPNTDLLVRQVAQFMCNCFKSSYTQTILNETPEEAEKRKNRRPILFKCGIAYGDIDIIKAPVIYGEKLFNNYSNTLLGIPVVKAVRLEENKNIIGPRLVFKKDIFDKLCPATQIFCRELEVNGEPDIYEYLWPVYLFLEQTLSPELNYQEYDKMEPALKKALLFWQKHFKLNENKIADKYFALIDLIIDSTILFFKIHNHAETGCKNAINTFINNLYKANTNYTDEEIKELKKLYRY
jgi:hypothetical protein